MMNHLASPGDEAAAAQTESLRRQIRELEQENAALRFEQQERIAREEALLAILSNTPAPIYLKDADFRYILVNRCYEELARVGLAQLKGLTDFDIFSPEVANIFRAQDEEVIGLRSAREFEETIPLADGVFSFITVKFPIFDLQGQIKAVGGYCTDITARKQSEKEREAIITQLQKALSEVATLRKILPICSSCRQVRDDQGYWNQLESYLRDHSDVEFSHGMCPACAEKLYGREAWFRKG